MPGNRVRMLKVGDNRRIKIPIEVLEDMNFPKKLTLSYAKDNFISLVALTNEVDKKDMIEILIDENGMIDLSQEIYLFDVTHCAYIMDYSDKEIILVPVCKGCIICENKNLIYNGERFCKECLNIVGDILLKTQGIQNI